MLGGHWWEECEETVFSLKFGVRDVTESWHLDQ